MEITRGQLIRKVAEKSDFYIQDIEVVFNALEASVMEYLNDVTLEEPVWVRIFKGLKLTADVLPERERVDPRDHSPIICKETVRLGCKYSEGFKDKIQKAFEDSKDQ